MASFVKATFLLLTTLMSTVGQLRPWPGSLPPSLLSHTIAARLHFDPQTISAASADFGGIYHNAPAAVLRPSTPADIASLLRLSHSSPQPFTVAARGHGHSTRGQAQAPGGVVMDMSALGAAGIRRRIGVSAAGGFVDAGGEQLWIDVLREALRFGLSPESWTDYLYLTVGGTLSNAGVGGQAFLYGPQISNVYELDVITGKGEMVTCSERLNPELFFAVLGGLSQLGVITRARIALKKAPKRVRWMRLMYSDFGLFTRDQERLISMKAEEEGWRLSYVEGSLLMEHSLNSNWRSSFFSQEDLSRIRKLAANNNGAIYCLEASFYYGYVSHLHQMDQDIINASSPLQHGIEELLQKLSFVPGFAFRNDVTYLSFLNRVHDGELKLRSLGLWDVPHPWLNLFVPKSNIMEFDNGVFKGILKRNKSMGPILIYPIHRTKWDERMSAAIPDEEIFYAISILVSSHMNDLESLEKQNSEILQFCDQVGMKYKQYLPHYTTRADWMKHFGKKWERFVEMKLKYDPKAILSPGQRIFTHEIDLRLYDH